MKKNKFAAYPLAGIMILLLLNPILLALPEKDTWPKRVLITNDNGIEDIKIVELAKALSKIADTTVIAPMQDRSGSTHYLTATNLGKLKVQLRTIGENIQAYAVDGFPADCVVLGLAGIMRDNPPDLVISGINGGPNLGKDWMFSGTIGAARIAAFAGIPAIAVSGLQSSMPGAMEAVIQWIVKLAQSKLIQDLKPPQYITVSVPRIAPDKIKGIRFAERAGLEEKPIFSRISSETGKSSYEIWAITGSEIVSSTTSSETDISLYEQGYIIIVPMIADELDYERIRRIQSGSNIIPKWDFLSNNK